MIEDVKVEVTPSGEKVPVSIDTGPSRRSSDKETLSQRAASIIERRDFVQHSWKPLLATAFVLIILFDFVAAPAYLGYTRAKPEQFVEVVKNICSESEDKTKHDQCMELRKVVTDYNYRNWSPLTLSDGVGLFYLAIGSILTGVAVYGHRGKGT